MSAILGIFHRDKKPVDHNVFSDMMASLTHRGQDGSGVWINDHIGIGHQMRWITPESLTEKLPFYDSDRQLTITADARIDNRDELFSKLAVPVNERSTISDSQLILFAYEKWGKSCVNYLVGDYVFAIWNGKHQQLYCATDPLGHRPVYYYIDHKIFAFASEIKALLKLPQVPKELNVEQFSRNLMFELSILENEETCFKGIRRVKSGHTMIVSEKTTEQETHSQPEFNKKLHLKSDADYFEVFRQLLDESVYCRMRSPYPVTCMLSGGLDSSTLTSIAAKKLQQTDSQLVCLAGMLPGDYKGPEKDERYFIELMKERWNLEIVRVANPDNGIYDQIEKVCRRVENPFIDTRHYHHQAFQDEAQKLNARIILDGYGGELSASSYGRGYYSELLKRGKWINLIQEIRAKSKVDQKSVISILLNHVLRPFAPGVLEYWYYNYQHHFNICAANSVIRPELAKRTNLNAQTKKVIKEIYKTHSDVSRNDKNLYDVNRSETFRLQDPQGSQMLYPFLDKRLLDFCFSIPTRLKVSRGWDRQLIRTGMEGMLPDQNQWRTSKMPFSPDHPSRIKRSEPEAREILASVGENEAIRNYIDIPRLSRLLDRLSKQPEVSIDNVYALNKDANLVQAGIHAIVFSRVFSEVF